jgi:hypothetical protein
MVNPHSIVAGSILRQFEGLSAEIFFRIRGARWLGLGVWRLHAFGREIGIAVESAYGRPVKKKRWMTPSLSCRAVPISSRAYPKDRQPPRGLLPESGLYGA